MESKEVKTESKSLHKFPKIIFVGENINEFPLLHNVDHGSLVGYDYNVLDKKDCGTNAKYTAEEIARRYNAHDELVKALQDVTDQLIVFSDMDVTNKKPMNEAIMQAKEALKKATE